MDIKTIEWSEEMSLGVAPIDADHKVLVSLVNSLKDSVVNKAAVETHESVLAHLFDYTEYHFKREEAIMLACGYPETEPHFRVHEKLKDQVTDFLDGSSLSDDPDTPAKLLNFLTDWLYTHIMVMDKSVEPWFEGKDAVIDKANQKFVAERGEFVLSTAYRY